MAEPTKTEEHESGPCLHCMLVKAYDEWVETQNKMVDAARVGYGLGQFMAETFNEVLSKASPAASADFIGHFTLAQQRTAELAMADADTKH